MVEFRDSSSQEPQTFLSRAFGANALSATLDNLMPFVNYEVRVRAENIAGQSNPSNVLMERTDPEGVFVHVYV